MRSGAVIAIVVSFHAAFFGAACVPPNPPTPCPNTASSSAPSATAQPTPTTTRAPIVGWPPSVMRCLQRGDSCGGSAATCRELASLSATARDEAMRCFDLSSCAAYDVCFRAFQSSHAMSPELSSAPTRDE